MSSLRCAPPKSTAAPIVSTGIARTRGEGETEQRLYLLNAWHESPLYSERERAALAWTEALTLVAKTHAPDGAYDTVRRHFADKELVDLSTLIGLLNLWNRLAIGFRSQHPVELTQ